MMQRTSEGKVGSEWVIDEVGLALVFDEEGEGEEDEEGLEIRDEPNDKARTSQVGERAGSAKSTDVDKDIVGP